VGRGHTRAYRTQSGHATLLNQSFATRIKASPPGRPSACLSTCPKVPGQAGGSRCKQRRKSSSTSPFVSRPLTQNHPITFLLEQPGVLRLSRLVRGCAPSRALGHYNRKIDRAGEDREEPAAEPPGQPLVGIEFWHDAERRNEDESHHDHFYLQQQLDRAPPGIGENQEAPRPIQKTAPMTRQLSAALATAKRMRPGATNITSPWIKASDPSTPSTHRASGLRRISSAAGKLAGQGQFLMPKFTPDPPCVARSL
jgi:hypothetical protein